MKKLRILLVDDHEVVRLGLKALLDRYPQFEVVAEASTADEALARVAQYRPDVVVMDVRLPGKNGIEATREIKATYPETEVIILTSYAEDDLLFDAIRSLSGCVMPSAKPKPQPSATFPTRNCACWRCWPKAKPTRKLPVNSI